MFKQANKAPITKKTEFASDSSSGTSKKKRKSERLMKKK